MMHKYWLIAKQEYLKRTSKRSFILGTFFTFIFLLLPGLSSPSTPQDTYHVSPDPPMFRSQMKNNSPNSTEMFGNSSYQIHRWKGEVTFNIYSSIDNRVVFNDVELKYYTRSRSSNSSKPDYR